MSNTNAIFSMGMMGNVFKATSKFLLVLVLSMPVGLAIADDDDDDDVGVQTLIEYRIVGFTTTTSDGDIQTTDANGTVRGVRAMHQLCKDEVAANARAANVEEYLRSTDVPLPAASGAWVIPTDIRVVVRPDRILYAAFDPSSHGQIQAEDTLPTGAVLRMTCSGYTSTSTSQTGARARISGELSNNVCSSTAPVACAAPVAVPVTQ